MDELPGTLMDHLERQQQRARQIQHLTHIALLSEGPDPDDVTVLFEVIEEIAHNLNSDLDSMSIRKAMTPAEEVQS